MSARARSSSPASSAAATSCAARRSTPLTCPSPARSIACTGGRLTPGAEVPVSIRQHDIRIAAADPLDDVNARARHSGPQRLPRQRAGLYRRGQGRHAAAHHRAAGGRFRPRRAVWLSAAAGQMPRTWPARQTDNGGNAHGTNGSRGGRLCRAFPLRRSPDPLLSTRVLGRRAAASKVTPELIEAAKKEGKVIWYTAVDLPVAERIAKAFEAKYPGIRRARRALRRRAHLPAHRPGVCEQHPRGRRASTARTRAHFIVWKRDGMLAPYVPEDVAEHYPAEHKDPDGLFASWRIWLCVIGYNTKLVKPRGGAQELRRPARSQVGRQDRQGASRLQRHHHDRHLPDLARHRLGLLREARRSRRVMQVQSSADPPKKLAAGERAVMADGNEYNLIQLKEKGDPVEIVYPTEGTPLIIGPSGVMKDAPNPNAAKLPAAASCSRSECQQLMVDFGAPALLPRAGEGQGGPQAAEHDQADEGRPRRGREAGRRDQGALHPVSSRCELCQPHGLVPGIAGLDAHQERAGCAGPGNKCGRLVTYDRRGPASRHRRACSPPASTSPAS